MPQRVQSIRSSTKLVRPATNSREPGELYVNFADKQLGVVDATKAAQDLIAVRFFSAATDYVAGDFVINAGIGYKAKGNIPAGAFNASQWETIVTGTGAEPPIAAGTTAQYWRGDKSWQTLDKTAVGLANVDNTSDANKPVSSATQAQLNLKAPLASPTFTGTVIAPTQPQGTNNTTVATTEFVARDFAPLLSPTFGGDPRSVTPATSDNDTSIATTAYVKANIAAIPGFPEAPNDANAYGRKALGWVDVTEEAPANSKQYVRFNGGWAEVSVPPGTFVGDAPPASPALGQLWWESDSGNLFIWYADPDSAQWVQVSGMPKTEPPTALARNRIVNGAMQISQENGIASGTTSGYYPADQWAGLFSGIPSTTFQRNSTSLPPGGVWRMAISVGTAKPSLAASDYALFLQKIEGTRVADFKWGTPEAKAAVLRFWAYSNIAGTYAVGIRNGALDRTYLTTYSLPAATTWTLISLAIPGDTTGTWATDTGSGLEVFFSLATGTNYHGVAGWQAGSKLGLAAAVNGVGIAGSGFMLSDVGLYIDPDNTGLAPKWQMPDEAEELRACQRYWSSMGPVSIGGYQATASGSIYSMMALPATMRAGPAIAATTAGTLTNVSAVLHDSVSLVSFRQGITLTAAGSGSVSGRVLAFSARM